MALMSRNSPGIRHPTRTLLQSRQFTRGHRQWTSWHEKTSHPSSRVQVYTSQSRDPYLNLSAEHFLLQNSHPESTVLFLCQNNPCIVIGRNQNPWLEVNLGLLADFIAKKTTPEETHNGTVSLVRRRSGGGAVFHDGGNVNFSVICPPAFFDRDKHAEMVVRALNSLGVGGAARVNERHDIVIDVDVDSGSSPPHHHQKKKETFKISGSAYKLTRLRSLHHGTCLLSSPNLAQIGSLLRSPAEPYIKARGVESVRSKIRNVDVAPRKFCRAVIEEFEHMYGAADIVAGMRVADSETPCESPDFAHEQILKGYRELTSPEWIYSQTPQFTFSTHPTEDDPRERPPLPNDIPPGFEATMTIRHGQVQDASVSGMDEGSGELPGQDLYRIRDWKDRLVSKDATLPESVGQWFNGLFGSNFTGGTSDSDE